MLNVDAWLDTIEPWQFDEWMAYHAFIEPDEMERIREILKLGFASQSLAKIKPSDLDPWDKSGEVEMDNAELEMAFVAAYCGK